MKFKVILLAIITYLVALNTNADYPKQADSNLYRFDSIGSIIINQTQTNTGKDIGKQDKPTNASDNSDKIGKQIDLLSNFITYSIGFLTIILTIVSFFVFIKFYKIEKNAKRKLKKADKMFRTRKRVFDAAISKTEDLINQFNVDSKKAIEDVKYSATVFFESKLKEQEEEFKATIAKNQPISEEKMKGYEEDLNKLNSVNPERGKEIIGSIFIEFIKFASQGNWQQALLKADQALGIDDKNDDFLNYKGLALINLGQNEEALKVLIQARISNDKNAAVWNNIGLAQTNIGIEKFKKGIDITNIPDFDEALESLKISLRLNPNRNETWTNLGVVYDMKGDRKQALEALAIAKNLNPNNPKTFYNLANVLAKEKRFPEARENIEMCILLNSNDYLAWETKCGILRDLGDMEGAELAQQESDRLKQQRKGTNIVTSQ
jgi:tetratricopeptide (TPR) repeat protein